MRILYANGIDELAFMDKLKARKGGADPRIAADVSAIIADVKRNGDAAVDKYTLAFDGELPQAREIPREEFRLAAEKLSPALLGAMERAAANIRAYHKKQAPAPFEERLDNGVILGRRCRGLHRVGLYVPGGKAAYPSTVLMNAIPAVIAGVGEIIMATPPQKGGQTDPAVLAAAAIAGVDRIFLAGGAQAVAAMAYGTETIPKVDKIVGPGNVYVETAKKWIYGEVDIDMTAGPSEILILADDTANPAFVAADLLSQAEHDEMACSILVTHSKVLADRVIAEIDRQKAVLPRKAIIDRALADYGAVVITAGVEESVRLANLLSPEHLEVMLPNPMEYLDRLDNAGSVFLGEYAPEPLGDYYAGPNHVLPTGQTARFFSPLSVESFLKYYSYTYYPQEALLEAVGDISQMADHEGFAAHARAVTIRREDKANGI
ncbi:MAG: histidinol dehydrogenase [Clostridiales bacterium]|nr:histidinol dehydrogenase [Clostridiales bacterium]